MLLDEPPSVTIFLSRKEQEIVRHLIALGLQQRTTHLALGSLRLVSLSLNEFYYSTKKSAPGGYRNPD